MIELQGCLNETKKFSILVSSRLALKFLLLLDTSNKLFRNLNGIRETSTVPLNSRISISTVALQTLRNKEYMMPNSSKEIFIEAETS